MQFSYLCTCIICEQSNAKSEQVISFSFIVMVVNLPICALTLGGVSGPESPLEAKFFHYVKEHFAALILLFCRYI